MPARTVIGVSEPSDIRRRVRQANARVGRARKRLVGTARPVDTHIGRLALAVSQAGVVAELTRGRGEDDGEEPSKTKHEDLP